MNTQNGYPVLAASDPRLYAWVIPCRTGTIKLRLRSGALGFLLAHFILWYGDSIEKLAGKVLDDWGYAPLRYVRGSSTSISNHSSGTAADLNATQHPLGTQTLSGWQKVKIRARLLIYRGCIRGGLDYHNRKDEMHYEIAKGFDTCKPLARRLMTTARGVRLISANPTQRQALRR